MKAGVSVSRTPGDVEKDVETVRTDVKAEPGRETGTGRKGSVTLELVGEVDHGSLSKRYWNNRRRTQRTGDPKRREDNPKR